MQKFMLLECVFISNMQQDSFHYYLYQDQFCKKNPDIKGVFDTYEIFPF